MPRFLPGGEVAVREQARGRRAGNEAVAAARELNFVPRPGEKLRVGAYDQVPLQNERKMIFHPRRLHGRAGAERENVVRNKIGGAVMLMKSAAAVRIDAGADRKSTRLN